MNSVCCRVNLNLISTRTMTKLGGSMLVCAAERYFEPLLVELARLSIAGSQNP